MHKKIFFAVVFASLAGACSAADPNQPEGTTTEEELKGSSCGGLFNKQCPQGYTCKTSGKCCDLPGVCVKKVCVQNVLCAINSHFDTPSASACRTITRRASRSPARRITTARRRASTAARSQCAFITSLHSSL